jgi:toxin-antitoxin system PIN domain toxin
MMISFDTNLMVYALNSAMPRHKKAYDFIESLADSGRVVIAEQMLVEVYLLIRNAAVFPRPYSAAGAAEVCMVYRQNPRWKLAECESVMEEVWKHAADADFPRRRIMDCRLALTLLNAGVTDFATANVNDFTGFGFDRVWDPTDGKSDAP